MYFGEQKTASGLIIKDDDGTTRGIYPRWAKVYGKGPKNTDPYEIGQWILIEHGRWTRGFKVDDGESKKELRMVEAESIIAYADEKPNDLYIGEEFSNGSSTTINPQDFIR
jgi:hypothetical protein